MRGLAFAAAILTSTCFWGITMAAEDVYVSPDIGACEHGGEKWVPGVTWPGAEIKKRLYEELLW